MTHVTVFHRMPIAAKRACLEVSTVPFFIVEIMSDAAQWFKCVWHGYGPHC